MPLWGDGVFENRTVLVRKIEGTLAEILGILILRAWEWRIKILRKVAAAAQC